MKYCATTPTSITAAKETHELPKFRAEQQFTIQLKMAEWSTMQQLVLFLTSMWSCYQTQDHAYKAYLNREVLQRYITTIFLGCHLVIVEQSQKKSQFEG